MPKRNIDVQLKIVRTMPFELAPKYGTEMAAAVDLVAAIEEEIVLEPGQVTMIPTGIAIYIGDPRYAAEITPRSGLGTKSGLVLANLQGLIDADYQGELFVAAWNRNVIGAIRSDGVHMNHERACLTIEPGMRLAQMKFIEVCHATFRMVGEFSEVTARGAGGWGSTGFGPMHEVDITKFRARLLTGTSYSSGFDWAALPETQEQLEFLFPTADSQE